jgi:hypothetical protein
VQDHSDLAGRRFIEMCRRPNLFAHAVTAIDGSKFKR